MSQFCFGCYVELDEPPIEEELRVSKQIVVELLCDEIKRLAKEEPDQFFMLYRNCPEGKMTLGAKLVAPTVKIDKLKGDF